MKILHSCVAEEGVIVQDVDVDIGNSGRVVGWVGQIHERGYIQRRLGSVDNAQIEDFGLQLRVDGTARRSFTALRDGCYTYA